MKRGACEQLSLHRWTRSSSFDPECCLAEYQSASICYRSGNGRPSTTSAGRCRCPDQGPVHQISKGQGSKYDCREYRISAGSSSWDSSRRSEIAAGSRTMSRVRTLYHSLLYITGGRPDLQPLLLQQRVFRAGADAHRPYLFNSPSR